MKLEVLLSCMHQQDDKLVRASRLVGDVVVINQCDREDYREYPTATGTARMFSTRQRGLTKSRNMAIGQSAADICLLCDDDEQFVSDYGEKILSAYDQLPRADVIIFKITNRQPSFPDKVRRLRFPLTMKVSSWQISFRRQSLLTAGIRFDELLGAGLALGSLVLVDDALGGSLVEQTASLVGSGLGGLDVIGLNGGADGLDGGLELGTDSLVALTRLLSGDDALLLRLDVSHVQFLSVSNI